MEVYLPEKYFKNLLFSLLEYEKPDSIEDYIKHLLEELVNMVENDESYYLNKSNEIIYQISREDHNLGLWSHPMNIPIKTRDKLDGLSKYSPIQNKDYYSHTRCIPGPVRKNIANGLCHALIIRALKIRKSDRLNFLSKNNFPLNEPSLNDIVELTSGPFRGEKAKIIHVDYTGEEITIELLDSMVPIPITVRENQIRIISKNLK